MDFKAEKIGNQIVVKPIIEKKINHDGGTDVTIHIPSFQRIQKLKKDIQENGKRDLQSFQSKSNE